MECGGCTLCCKLLETHDVPSEIGTYCHHCDQNVGCSIYSDRPKECRDYQCMWSQMENVGFEMRPDQCGVIFDRISDDVITARLEEDRMLNELTQRQLDFFKNEGFSVLIFRGRDKKIFLNGKHTEDQVMEVVRGCGDLH